MMTEEQIEAKVREKYPKTREERNCKQAQEIMRQKREWYREQLRAEAVGCPTLN